MKTNISLNLAKILKSKGLLMIAAGFLAASCGTAASGYSETDGVYYDPDKDTIPQTEVYTRGNQVGEEYDYQDSTQVDVAHHGRRGYNENWNKNDTPLSSDWGSYAGTQSNYNIWGSPFGGFYAPYYGFGNSFGMNFGFGNFFGYNDFFYDGFYSPFYNGFYGYSPYSYYGMYNPFFSPYNNFYPYGFGYYAPFYGNTYYSVPRRSSGRDGYINSSNTGRMGSRADSPGNAGRLGQRSNGAYNTNGGFRNSSTQPVRRVQKSDKPMRRSAPKIYQQQNNNRSNGGFRSGGFNGGSSRSGGISSGSSSSSSRSSGGFRTGGR